MTIETTGSLVYGLQDGLGKEFETPSRDITIINGTPATKLQVNIGSQIVYDVTNAAYYMGLTGSSWIVLGSVSA